MKRTMNRVFALAFAIALPLSGLTIAANTNAPAKLEVNAAYATPGDPTSTPTPTARPVLPPNRHGRPTPYPTLNYDPSTGRYSGFETSSRTNVWWNRFGFETYYDNLLSNNTSVNIVGDHDSTTFYIGPWSKYEIAADLR